MCWSVNSVCLCLKMPPHRIYFNRSMRLRWMTPLTRGCSSCRTHPPQGVHSAVPPQTYTGRHAFNIYEQLMCVTQTRLLLIRDRKCSHSIQQNFTLYEIRIETKYKPQSRRVWEWEMQTYSSKRKGNGVLVGRQIAIMHRIVKRRRTS